MKNILLGAAAAAAVVVVAFSAGAFAQNAGVLGMYTGLQLGHANLNYSKNDFNPSASKLDDTGFAGRVFGGYDFNEFFSAELGYIYFPKVKLNNSGNSDFTQQGVDLLAKGSLPLDYGFSVNGKAGLAWIHRDNPPIRGAKDNNYVPVLGIGASYGLTDNLSAGLDYAYYFKHNDLQNINFYALNLIYSF